MALPEEIPLATVGWYRAGGRVLNGKEAMGRGRRRVRGRVFLTGEDAAGEAYRLPASAPRQTADSAFREDKEAISAESRLKCRTNEER